MDVNCVPYAYKVDFYFTRESVLESTSDIPRNTTRLASIFKCLPSEPNLLFVVAR